MAGRVAGVGVDVVDRVLVEGVGVAAVEDVGETWRVGQAEDAPSGDVSAFWLQGEKGGGGMESYEGECLGEQTMAMLSGIMT